MTVGTTFFGKSVSTFSIGVTRAVFKSQVQLYHRIPRVDFYWLYLDMLLYIDKSTSL